MNKYSSVPNISVEAKKAYAPRKYKQMDRKQALQILATRGSHEELTRHVNAYERPRFACAPVDFDQGASRYFNGPSHGTPSSSRLIITKKGRRKPKDLPKTLERAGSHEPVRSEIAKNAAASGWALISNSILNTEGRSSSVVQILGTLAQVEEKRERL